MCTGNSSAVQRHFAQFERHQLQQVNSEIELGWNCGICQETAEDPCVTRCGHLHCRSHLNEWLSKTPLCPVCQTFCTPAHDVVPIFSRDQASSSPVESPITSECSSPVHDFRTPSTESSFESPATDTYHPWKPSHLLPDSSHAHDQAQPHTFNSHIYAHYLGIALRVLGLALLLSVLLPGGYFADSPPSSHPIT